LPGLKMTTTGLNSNDNKTDSTCSFNKKSNPDSDDNCAADDDEKTKYRSEAPQPRCINSHRFDWTLLA
jgi:hypothetical protein